MAFYRFASAMIEATKCSLRNDILSIYDKCKDSKKITKWQLEAILHSHKTYKALKGNSFVETLVEKVLTFDVID
jgi:inorganic pyrophosphatase